MRLRRPHERTGTRPAGDVPRRALSRARLALVIAAAVALPGGITAGATAMISPGGAGGDEPPSWTPGTLPVPGEAAAGEAAGDRVLAAFMDPVLLEAVPVGPGPVAGPVEQVLGSAEVVTRLGESGIPEVALAAYMQAADAQAAEDPACGIRWTLLAAIGRVESNHGRFGGAELRDDGYGTRPIRGIPLDGRDNVALIRDTDDGELDGDTTYDRAVGPMQFIPSTWAGSGADGNGDGRNDPNNIFDAARGAARYLCAGGADLTSEPGRAGAVRRYNNAAEYVDLVLRLAADYEAGGVPALPPIGNPPFEPVDVAAGPSPPPVAPPGPSPSPPAAAVPSPPRPPRDGTSAPSPSPAPGPRPTPPPTTVPPTTVPPTTVPPTTVPPTTVPPTTVPPTTVPPTTVPPTTVPGEPPAEPPCTDPTPRRAPPEAPPVTAAVGWAPAMREVVVDILDDPPAEPPDPAAAPAPPTTCPPDGAAAPPVTPTAPVTPGPGGAAVATEH